MKFRARIRFEPPEVQQTMQQHPEIIADERKNLLEMLQMEGVRAASEAAPVHKRPLRDSLFPGRMDSATELLPGSRPTRATVGSKLIYAGPQEDAAAYTARKKWWPPHEPIRDWVRLNHAKFGVSSDSEINRVAFFIRRKIATQGIKPKNYLAAGFDRVVEIAPRAVTEAAKNIIRKLGFR